MIPRADLRKHFWNKYTHPFVGKTVSLVYIILPSALKWSCLQRRLSKFIPQTVVWDMNYFFAFMLWQNKL